MTGFPIDALIAAGGTVLGQVLGKSKERSPREQILSTVKGARQAGIHPLAALGSGASYSTVGGSSSIGSAIGAGMEKFAAHLANQKTEEEIGALRADTEARRAQAELYRAQSRSIISAAGSHATGGPRPGSGDVAKNLKMFGQDIQRDPTKFSTAQDVQDEFGDIVENFVGLPSIAWSVGQNINKRLPTDAEIVDYLRGKSGYNFKGGRYAH